MPRGGGGEDGGGEERGGQDKSISIAVMLQRLQAAKGQVRKLEEALRDKGIVMGDDSATDSGASKEDEAAVRRQQHRIIAGAAGAKHEEPRGRRKVVGEEGEEEGSFEESFWDPREVMRDLGAKPVGHIKTCFPKKNGCPRQGSVCPSSVAHLDLAFGNNPHHGALGLTDYSHVWLLFLFDLNGTDYTPRPHVMPPRLRGKTMGVFATRSPHRPNPIGLSLVRLDGVIGRRLILSGVDLVDGTPILDVKPYIPSYDAPVCYISADEGCLQTRCKCGGGCMRCPEWATPTRETSVSVEWALSAMASMKSQKLSLRVLRDWEGLVDAVTQVVQADPRSNYRRDKCAGEEYAFYLDNLDVTVEFSDSFRSAIVTGVKHMTNEKAKPGDRQLLPAGLMRNSRTGDVAGANSGWSRGAGEGLEGAVREWGRSWLEGVEGARSASMRLLDEGC